MQTKRLRGVGWLCSVTVLLGTMAVSQAVDRLWVGGDNDEWSETTNWDPAGTPGLADRVFFDANGDGEINVNDLPDLRLNSFVVSNYQHTTAMNGNTFTSTTFAVHGIGDQTEAYPAKWDATGSGNLLVLTELRVAGGVPGSALLGPRIGATRTNGFANVTMGADVGLQVGTPGTYATYLMVGFNDQNSTPISASLVAGKKFNAYVNNLFIGRRPSGNAGTGLVYGKLDLSSVTDPGVLYVPGGGNYSMGGVSGSGELIVSDAIAVRIGASSASRATFLIQNQIVPGGIRLGTNRFEIYTTTFAFGNTAGSSYIDAANVSEGIIDASGDVTIGIQPAGSWQPNTEILLSDAVSVKIGSPTTRVLFDLALVPSLTTNLFQMGTNRFEAYLHTLRVGRGSGTTSFTGPRNIATLDLSSVQNGTLVVSNLLWMGHNAAIVATIDLSDGFTTTIGAPGARAAVTNGSGQRWVSSTFTAGGTFNAWLSEMAVGDCGGSAADVVNQALFDLSRVTNGTLDVSGVLRIGAQLAYSRGTVTLPAGMTAAAGQLIVGTNTVSSRGLLELNGTVMKVSGSVHVNGPDAGNQGRITTTLSGTSGGLDLAAAAGVTVGAQGNIHIVFAEPPLNESEIYWGLRWEGDKVTELAALAAEDKLTWNADAVTFGVSIFKDATHTFVGKPPPKGTVLTIR